MCGADTSSSRCWSCPQCRLQVKAYSWGSMCKDTLYIHICIRIYICICIYLYIRVLFVLRVDKTVFVRGTKKKKINVRWKICLWDILPLLQRILHIFLLNYPTISSLLHRMLHIFLLNHPTIIAQDILILQTFLLNYSTIPASCAAHNSTDIFVVNI